MDIDWAPCLYLYCKTDTLCDHEMLDMLIEEKKRRGQRVFSKCWDESEHCSHITVHPTEYRQQVYQFLSYLYGQSYSKL